MTELNLSNFTYQLGFQNIQGVKSLMFFNGKASFSSLRIFSKPNSEAFFKVSSNSIKRYFGEYYPKNKNFSDANINSNYAYIFSIQFRECQIGEIFLSKLNRCLYFY